MRTCWGPASSGCSVAAEGTLLRVPLKTGKFQDLFVLVVGRRFDVDTRQVRYDVLCVNTANDRCFIEVWSESLVENLLREAARAAILRRTP